MTKTKKNRAFIREAGQPYAEYVPYNPYLPESLNWQSVKYNFNQHPYPLGFQGSVSMPIGPIRPPAATTRFDIENNPCIIKPIASGILVYAMTIDGTLYTTSFTTRERTVLQNNSPAILADPVFNYQFYALEYVSSPTSIDNNRTVDVRGGIQEPQFNWSGSIHEIRRSDALGDVFASNKFFIMDRGNMELESWYYRENQNPSRIAWPQESVDRFNQWCIDEMGITRGIV